MNILKKINQMRLDRNWSIYRLSIESGISQSTLTNMFNRETLPSITTLECICAAFGVSLSAFFEEDAGRVWDHEEQEVLRYYNSLSRESKACVLTLLRELSKK